MMLAIDTSSAASSVALLDPQSPGDDQVLGQAQHIDARRHAEVLATLVEQVLDGRVPRAIAVGVGPGPYTGLRVGVGTAQVLAHAWKVPVVGVCSLDVIASGAARLGIGTRFAVATDARRREVYWAHYDQRGRRIDGPFVQPAAAIPVAIRGLPWVGEGAALNPDHLHEWVAGAELRYPSPVALAHLATEGLAAGENPAHAVASLSRHGEDDGSTARALSGHRLLAPYPLYVRRPDAAEPGAPKSGVRP